MNNLLQKIVVLTTSINSGIGLSTAKLICVLFISTLAGLFSLSANAADLTGTASKIDSGFYDGSYGKGAYWVTPGLYGSMFSVGSKVKRYFIYSHYQRDPASDFIQISHDVARAETELMRNKLGLPRKIQIKILGSYKQKTLSSRKPTTLINNF